MVERANNEEIMNRIVEVLRHDPTISQEKIGGLVGVGRKAAAAAIQKLVNDGTLLPKGFYPIDFWQKHQKWPSGFVLVRSPADPVNIPELEAVLERFFELGAWFFTPDDDWDYIFVLQCGIDDYRLRHFYSEVRALSRKCVTFPIMGTPPLIDR